MRMSDWSSDVCSSDLGRAAPALASLDRAGRVIHIGSFSKTISPALRLGFVVAPPALITRFAEVAACLAPSHGPAVQLAKIGRASGRERVCQSLSIQGVAVSLKRQ